MPSSLRDSAVDGRVVNGRLSVGVFSFSTPGRQVERDRRARELRSSGNAGFTLIELLAVMAVITILAGIFMPALGSARRSALKARTQAQFSQWAAACEQFRQEYGYYPPLGSQGRLATAADTLAFVRTLSGRNPDGSAVTTASDLGGNFKHVAFCTFFDGDFRDPDQPDGAPDYSGNELLCDAFGNTEIGVLIDRNGDGVIKPADDGQPAAVHGMDSDIGLAPADTVLPSTGIRAGVLFYSAGRGRSSADLILSWK